MRLLHTSDWHLGRSFHRADLLPAQAMVVDHVVEVVRSERVDVVLISGDIYDRALPGTDAIALLDDALTRLRQHARVVLISGNHDSPRRLGFGHRLIDAAGVYVRTDPATAGIPVLLEDAHGPVAIYPVPYLEPEAVAPALDCADRTHAAVISAAAARARADLATQPPGTRSVLLAHAFVTGAAASDSERDISVGGLCDVPMSAFDGMDYTALGHLHGPQQLSRAVRYSGSPLPYSFSEEHHRKCSWLVELGAAGLAEVTTIDVPVWRPVARICGALESLLTEARWSAYEGHYLAITLTDPVRPREPMERLRRRFPHTLLLTFEPDGGVTRDPHTYVQRLRGRSDLEITNGFVEFVRDRAADEWERTLLREAVEHAQRLDTDGSARRAETA
jgi:exonuclease SbcD